MTRSYPHIDSAERERPADLDAWKAYRERYPRAFGEAPSKPGPIGDPFADVDDAPPGPDRNEARVRAFGEMNRRTAAFGRSLRRRGLYKFRLPHRPPRRVRAPRRSRTRRACSARRGPRESRAGPDGDGDEGPGDVDRPHGRRGVEGVAT
jgi:hypothetical protein